MDIGISLNRTKLLRVLIWNIDGSEMDSIKCDQITEILLRKNADVAFLAEDFLKTNFRIDSLLASVCNFDNHTSDTSLGHPFYSKYRIIS